MPSATETRDRTATSGRLGSSAVTAADESPERADEQPPWRWRRVGPAVTVAAVAGGLLLRFVADSPLWLDEALSVHIAGGDLSLSEALRRDGHPALYYLLLGWWIDAFGGSEASVRAMSGAFAVATIPFIWLAARRYGNSTAGIACLLALSSPFLLRYATEARMYALIALLVSAGWWAVQRAHARPTIANLALVAAITAGLVHSHYWTFFVIAAAAVILAAAGRQGDDAAQSSSIRVLTALAVGVASLVVWLDVFLDQLAHTGTPWAERARPTEVLIETLQAIGGNNRFEGETLGVILFVLVVIGSLAVLPSRPQHVDLQLTFDGPMASVAGVLLVTLALGAGAALITAGAFEARYAAAVVPFVVVLAARGIAALPEISRGVVLALVVLLGLAIGVDEARRTRSQGEEVATVINREFKSGDLVVFCPDQIGPATVHYLEMGLTTAAFPSGDGRTVDWRDYVERIEKTSPEEFARQQSDYAGSGDVWLVGSTGYRGFGTRCAAMVNEFRRQRIGHETVANTDVFESMFMVRFEARQ